MSFLVHGVLLFGSIQSLDKKKLSFAEKTTLDQGKRIIFRMKTAVKEVKLIKEKKRKVVSKKRIVKKKVERKKSFKKAHEPLVEISLSKKRMKNSGVNNEKAKYLNKIREIVLKNKYYPPVAKRLKQKGRVAVSFKISWPNKVSGIQLKEASHHELLNESALNTIRSLDDIPPMPDLLKSEVLEIEAPLEFEQL